MTERRKLIFDALEKIYYLCKELKLEDCKEKVWAHILHHGGLFGYSWDFVLDLQTGRSYIRRRETVEKNKHFVDLFVEYPLLFTDEQKDMSINDDLSDFFHVAEQLILSWDKIKYTITRRRNEYEFELSKLKTSVELQNLFGLKKQMIDQINEQIVSEKLKNFIA